MGNLLQYGSDLAVSMSSLISVVAWIWSLVVFLRQQYALIYLNPSAISPVSGQLFHD